MSSRLPPYARELLARRQAGGFYETIRLVFTNIWSVRQRFNKVPYALVPLKDYAPGEYDFSFLAGLPVDVWLVEEPWGTADQVAALVRDEIPDAAVRLLREVAALSPDVALCRSYEQGCTRVEIEDVLGTGPDAWWPESEQDAYTSRAHALMQSQARIVCEVLGD